MIKDWSVPGVGMWKNSTNLTFSRRGDALLKVDEALDAYDRYTRKVDLYAHAIQTLPPEGRKLALALFNALNDYLASHGGQWARIERNIKSNGMMQRVHAQMQDLLDFTVARNPSREALEEGAARARLGVLYLFANTEVATQHAAILLEGALKVASQATGLIPAAGPLAVGPIALDGTDVVAPATAIGGGVSTYYKTSSAAPTMTAPISLPVSAPPATRARSAAVAVPPPVRQPPRVAVRQPPPLPVVAASPFGWVDMETVVAIGEGLYDAGSWLVRLGADAVRAIYAKIKEYVEYVITQIRAHETTVITLSGAAVAALVKAAVGYIAKAAAPLAGSVITIVEGVAEIIGAAKARIGVAIKQRQFVIQAGHPEVFANEIRNAMNWAIGHGMWSTLKGTVSLGLTFVSAGASTIAEVVAAAIEFVTKYIMRLREAHRLTKVLEEAKTKYAECRITDGTEVKPLKGSLVTNTGDFTRLYKNWCEASPCVPMLTLNSGICGDLMQLMKMFQDVTTSPSDTGVIQHNVVTAESFQAGADYFSQLKSFGRDYLKQSGFAFTSKSKFVSGLLSHAVSHHDLSASAADKAIAFVRGS